MPSREMSNSLYVTHENAGRVPLAKLEGVIPYKFQIGFSNPGVGRGFTDGEMRPAQLMETVARLQAEGKGIRYVLVRPTREELRRFD